MSVIDTALNQIKSLHPYTPGKPVEELERELGITDSIKLASNENPLGCSPRVQEVIEHQLSEVSLYPDANAYYLKQALAKNLGVETHQLTMGNGSNDVLDLIARTFLTSGKEAVFSEFAFIIYPLVTQACGAKARISKALPRQSAQAYGHNLEGMLEQINENTAVVFIANPNNPTGTWVEKADLLNFIEAVPEHIAVVIDEAYFEYVNVPDYPDSTTWLNQFNNLIVTRTFSKIYGLAGLRLGYAISSPEISDLLNRVRQPFNANLLALSAAKASLEDSAFVEQSIQVNTQGLSDLKQYCSDKGLFYIPSAGNFLTVEFGSRTSDLYQKLLNKGIIVRPLGNYQLHDFLRISIGTPDQMQRLYDSLSEIL
ncbi:MAG: histidinol-phosphate transaminase [Gammaproteobacteria bacterium]|nr:histidinol-phosphate transaminase [Gammaproteobacteria bacterium]